MSKSQLIKPTRRTHDGSFAASWHEANRYADAMERYVQDTLHAAGATHVQIRNGWLRPVDDFYAAQFAELQVISYRTLKVGDVVGIYDCYENSARYLTLWTVVLEYSPKVYRLEFKDVVIEGA